MHHVQSCLVPSQWITELECACVLMRLHGCAVPKSEYGKRASATTVSIRYGREVGSIMLVYLVALAYAPTCPLILPFTLVRFQGCCLGTRKFNVIRVSDPAGMLDWSLWGALFCFVGVQSLSSCPSHWWALLTGMLQHVTHQVT